MKTLLRSCFVADPTDSSEQHAQNYHAMVDSSLGFELPEDNIIWTFVQDFFKAHGHVPLVQSIVAHFEAVHENDVVDRLERLVLIKPRTRGDFLTYLEEKNKDRRNRAVIELAKEMAQITSTGLEVKGPKGKSDRLFGALDAIRHVLDKSHDLVAPTLGTKLSGNLMQDGQDFMARYDRVKADPKYGIGQYCGIAQIDAAMNGAKRYELWVHAGFTGALKSTTGLHWAYIQAVYYGFSTVYFSLEMPYLQCRNMIYTMHSAHEDFQEIRKQLGIETVGLDYEKVRDGNLEPNEEKFLREYIVPSMNKTRVVPPRGKYALDPRDYGDIHIEVADPDKSDFTVADLRAKAELIFSKTPFSLIVVDHGGLMAARQRYSSTTEKLNEVVRDLKRLAMAFNRGMGIAILLLFQINREGFKQAEKNGGRYNLAALAYANECVVRATPVLTDAGIAPIEEIEAGTRVWSRSGWKKVVRRFDQGKRRIWRIQNDRGAVLEVTGDHRVRVLRDEKISWCRVRDLRPGDGVLSVRGEYPWPAKTPWLPSRPSTPRRLTEELAYLLGAWDGDGRVRPKKIAFTGNRSEKRVRRKIHRAFFAIFGERLLEYEKSRPGSFDDESLAHEVRTQWFEDLAGPRGEKVPEVVLRSPKRFLLAYLKGLWDTDGWINNQHVVGLKMKSESFLRTVQLLMTALGYDTNLSSSSGKLKATGKRYTGWTLRLRNRESYQQFAEEIGFTEPWKAARLQAVLKQPVRDMRTYPVSATFYNLSLPLSPYGMVKRGRATRGFEVQHQRARCGETVSHGAVLTLLRLLREEGKWDENAQRLEDLVTRHLVARVVQVEKTDRIEPVYDLEVTGDHEYQTGQFLSHNCERSADVVTATWIDDALRKMSLAIFQCLKSRDQKPFDRIPVKIEFSCRRLLTDNTTSIEELDEKLRNAKGESKPIVESRQTVPDLAPDLGLDQ